MAEGSVLIRSELGKRAFAGEVSTPECLGGNLANNQIIIPSKILHNYLSRMAISINNDKENIKRIVKEICYVECTPDRVGFSCFD